MKALTLDPGALCGFAVGDLGSEPRWGTHRTARGASTGEALSSFAGWLRELLIAEQADICVFESPYVPHRGAEIPRNALTVRRLHAYSGIIEAVCWRLKIKVYEARPSEICRHFTGQGSWGGRDKKKAATVRACLGFGWDVAGQIDAADALSLWSYAEAVLDPVAAAQRRGRLGLELDLHGVNPGTGKKRSAPRAPRSASRKPSAEGVQTNGSTPQQDIAATGQLQLSTG